MVVPKPRATISMHIHLSLEEHSSAPPRLSILFPPPSPLLGWEQPATSIHPQSWEALSWLQFSIFLKGGSRYLFGKKRKKVPKSFIL